MMAKLGFGLNDGFTFPEIALPYLFQVRKEFYRDAFLHFISKLDGVNVFRDNVFGLFHAFLSSGFHALNSYFYIYKPFHQIISAYKGVFGKSLA